MLTPPSPRKRLFQPPSRPPLSPATPPSPTKMSRLPTLSTPGRLGTPSLSSSTGIPTPTNRRPRSSLGPNGAQLGASTMGGGEEMDLALKEVLRNRPPSSLKVQKDDNYDPDTPPQLSSQKSYLAPRTPSGLRPRTPSGLAHTPSASRAVSRGSVASRPSITGTNTFTPRRTSMASSTTSSTPYARRPESRASMAGGIDEKFSPIVGDRVRMQSMGMEGTLRYIGETEFKAGVWAGVELEGGFAGKGKNDGSVNGVPYFACPPLCGVFVLASKLSPPTAGISRPASVASSHRSLASSHASFSLSGRMTPSDRPRPMTSTPGRATRTPSASVRSRATDDDDARPARTLLGTSTSTNAVPPGNITAGSRASKYLGMTAKQLDNARAGTLNASVKNLRESTTTTPKAARVSVSMNGTTPVRLRQSIGGNFATPKPRVPRASQALESMPPPPSPGNIGRTLSAHQSQLEEEIRELKRKNAELEAELKDYVAPGTSDDEQRRTEALQAEVDRIREEADSLRSQLSASQADAADASKLAEELQGSSEEAVRIAEQTEKELASLRKEMELEAERAQGELDAGIEAKREEVRLMQERAEIAETDLEEMRALVEELTQAGQATISLYETKQYDLEDKIRTLEDKTRSLEDKLAKAREEAAAAPSVESREAITAAEIDNETLTAQLKHFQQKLSNLEEELEETRAQAESDADSWKARLAKAKDAERVVLDREREVKEEVKRLQKAAEGAKGRIGELEGALKENNLALEGSRAEIEGLRGDAAEATTMRAALTDLIAKEKALAEKTEQVEELKKEVGRLGEFEAKLKSAEGEKETLSGKTQELEAKVTALEQEVISLKTSQADKASQSLSPSGSTRKNRLSTGSANEDDAKRMRGFQHIIQELSAENAELKEKHQNVLEEVALLKEEIKLLEETSDLGENGEKPAGAVKELVEAKAALQSQTQTIRDLNREVSELESLIESKIYREDELETRLSELERELSKQRASTASARPGLSHSRHPSTADSTATEDRCELCEGPHDLDACPVFAGNMGGEDGPSPSAVKEKKGKWCADCESVEHDTAECPLAEEVF